VELGSLVSSREHICLREEVVGEDGGMDLKTCYGFKSNL
jgi:hypothetical protein